MEASNYLGYVYLLKAHDRYDGFYKIGKSDKPDERLKKFSGLPFDVELIHTIECKDPFGVEAELHSRFSEKRYRGEWFELTDEDVSVITSYSDQNDVLAESKESTNGVNWTEIEQYMASAGIDPPTMQEFARRSGVTMANLSKVTQGKVTQGKVDWLDAPEGINVWKWMEALLLIEELVDEQGFVSAKDIQGYLDLNDRTARKYVDILAGMEGWEIFHAEKKSRGRPPKAVSKINKRTKNHDIRTMGNKITHESS